MREAHSFDAAVADMAVQGLNRALRMHDSQKALGFLRQTETSARTRALFVDEHGRMGLGPACMAEGGVVCILFGGSTPYILRPTGSDGEFHFLGECYVYGMMDGEGMVEYQQNREVTPTWFHLK
jgi:hypothetical protein